MVGAALACLVWAEPAQAQACPLDGSPLTAPARPPWNAGAGVDSDGCVWSLDPTGARRVVGLDVVECGSCRGVFDPAELGAGAEPVDVERARAVLRALSDGKGGARRGEDGALELLERAAALARALAPRDPAREGMLLLRAAWAARARAVLGGDDGGYRPRSIGEARALLAKAEGRAARGGDDDPALELIASMERGVEAARRDLEAVEVLGAPGPDGVGLRWDLAQARARLVGVERDLAALRRRISPPTALPAVGLELVLARAWARFGDPAARDRWLLAAGVRHGARVAAEVERIRDACAVERDLLARARPLLEAAGQAARGEDRARLLLLAGDAARRTGDATAARPLLEAAAAADPTSPWAGRARLLLEP